MTPGELLCLSDPQFPHLSNAHSSETSYIIISYIIFRMPAGTNDHKLSGLNNIINVSLTVLELRSPQSKALTGCVPSGSTGDSSFSSLFQLLRGHLQCAPHSRSCHLQSQQYSIFKFLPPSLSCSEKAMAPHSSTLAWKIPWTEEPGRLQSMGSLGVGHD